MTFGKFKGKTLKEVIDLNMPYLNWCLTEVSFFNILYEVEEYIEVLKNEGKCEGLSLSAKLAIDSKIDAMEISDPYF